MNQTATPAATLAPRRTRVEFWIIVSALVLAYSAYLSPMVLAILVGAVVFVLAGMRFRPLLLAVLFFLPINPYIPWDLPIKDLGTLVRLCLFVGVVIARQRGIESPWKWLFSGRVTHVILAYFSVTVLSSVVLNGPTSAVAHELMRLVSYLCFYYTIIDWVRTEADFHAVINTMLLSTIGVALFGFYQAIIGDYSQLFEILYPIQEEALKNPPFSGRITSFISHYNTLAGYLNMIIPFAIYLSVKARNIDGRRLARLCFAFSSIAMVLTQSRGGLLAYVGVIMAAAYLLAPDRRARIRWIGSLLLFCVLAYIAVGLMFERLSGVDTYTEVTRLEIWAGAALIFLSRPLVGIGYGNFKTIIANTITVQEGFMLDAHNLYMELLAETGLLGFVTFLTLAATVIRRGVRNFRTAPTLMSATVSFGVAIGIMSVMAHGAVDYLFHNSPQFAALFFLLLALLRADEIRRDLTAPGTVQVGS